MKFILIILFLFPILSIAQQPGELVPPKKINYSFFVELNGGMTTTLENIRYTGRDGTSPYLNSGYGQDRSGFFLNFKFGFQLEKKHSFAVGVENMELFNNYSYFRENVPNIGLVGVGSSSQASYLGINFHYDYTLFRAKWFSMSLGLQAGIGLDDSGPSYWDKQGWVSQSIDKDGNIVSMVFTNKELTKKTRRIFVYGFNWAMEFEIIKNKLVLGTEVKVIHAPYEALRSYDVAITDNQEPKIEFEQISTILNLNLGIKVRYLFGSNLNEDATGF